MPEFTKPPIETTVFVHAFKDHKILRGVVIGHGQLDGYAEDFTQIRLDSGLNIICRIRGGDIQSRLADKYRQQNRLSAPRTWDTIT